MDTAVFLGTAENFVYGLCSAYFIYESATYFRHRREQRFYRTAAAIMAFWFLPALEGMPDFSAEVEALFVEKKLHRNHDLSVSQLAREIGTNRSYLSAWLNNTLGTNFCDFVNG